MIIFDESHGETWTIRKDVSLSISPDNPENHYYGHLEDLFQDELNIGSSAMAKWSEDDINSARLLIIAHPSLKSAEPNVGGEPIFSATEIDTIVEFVRNGGGLFVIGEHSTSRWGSNINELLKFFGLSLNNDTLARPRPDTEAIQTRHFPIMVSTHHAICEDIFEITYHRGCSISTINTGTLNEDPITTNAITTLEGACVCATSEFGKGRVVVIGDSDLFSLPYIGHSDNVRLLLNTACWLLDRPAKHIEKRNVIILRRGCEVRDFPKATDLRTIDGDHLFASSISSSEFSSLAEALPNPYDECEDFLRECEFRFHRLPEQLRRAVVQFKRKGNAFGALHISGLPLDANMPPTPGTKFPPKDKKSFWSETWLGMIGQALGDPIGYSVHHDGEIFQNVCPIAGEEREQSAGSSRAFLEWHTEQVFHPELPDFVVLLCLRNDPGRKAKTVVASVANVLAHIPISLRQVLFQPRFRAGIDYSFGATTEAQKNGGPIVPLLYGQAYDPYIKFDLEQTQPIDRDAAFAFSVVKNAVKQVYNYVKLQPGEMLIIDNRRSIHARSIFTPNYGGTDRWLQRIYARRDIATTNEERYRNERIIDTTFFSDR